MEVVLEGRTANGRVPVKAKGGQNGVLTAILDLDIKRGDRVFAGAGRAGKTGICRRQSGCLHLWRRCRILAQRPPADGALPRRRSYALWQDGLWQARRTRPGHGRLAAHSVYGSGRKRSVPEEPRTKRPERSL